MLKRFLTPHERRMSEAYRKLPALDPIAAAALQRKAEMDLDARASWKKLRERLPLLALSRLSGGSGLRMSKTLRYFFGEYRNRIALDPAKMMPTSFNVVEAFLRFSDEYILFDLRKEEEHLLRSNDFLQWYAADGRDVVKDPAVLKDIMREGTVYSYDMVGGPEDFIISAHESDIAPLGVSLIRHSDELSVILLAGEEPPYPPDGQVQEFLRTGTPVPGREVIQPDVSLSPEDRLVPGLPERGQVLLLTRIYLDSRRYDVRYVNLDLGQSFLVYTDDPIALGEHPEPELLEALGRGLHRYDDLFSALTALIYLPALFVARQPDVVVTRFATELAAQKNKAKVKRALRVLGAEEVSLYRQVKCLATQISPPSGDSLVVQPPDLKSVSEGFWKDLEPFQIGEDKDGNPIVGRTWVERRESWFTHTPTSFLARRKSTGVAGPDPGVIYVMRSPAHERDLYKVGLTRRSVAVRAQEIGDATGVPLPFGVLANWEVGDCSAVELEVHRRLAQYRLSKRREFFRAPLPTIVAVINEVARRRLTE